ncbi:MAG: 6-carboxytetrahydropterin synthase [archaeon]|jgi:6-pyruvoyltetrahydropterin/6-carboxytetrahydropterin synthase
MFEINTSANFEAAHRLSSYEGKCKQIHGHNWKVELNASSSVLDKNEFVYDFTNLKKILNEFDHKTILKNNTKNKKLVKSFPTDWVVWLDFEPSAEQLAKYICNKISSQTKLEFIKITVWENEKSSASFEMKK